MGLNFVLIRLSGAAWYYFMVFINYTWSQFVLCVSTVEWYLAQYSPVHVIPSIIYSSLIWPLADNRICAIRFLAYFPSPCLGAEIVWRWLVTSIFTLKSVTNYFIWWKTDREFSPAIRDSGRMAPKINTTCSSAFVWYAKKGVKTLLFCLQIEHKIALLGQSESRCGHLTCLDFPNRSRVLTPWEVRLRGPI